LLAIGWFAGCLRARAGSSRAQPTLAEKITWTVNKDWLTKLRFYTYVSSRGSDGLASTSRFLSKMVIRMQPAVFAPREVPPMPRLYFITAGSALYRTASGKRETLGPGRCWGASDVMSLHVSARTSLRAVAASFLHVQWIGPKELRALRHGTPRTVLNGTAAVPLSFLAWYALCHCLAARVSGCL
jgi:hypothetical protein